MLILFSLLCCSCSGKFKKIEPIVHPYKLSSQIEEYLKTNKVPQRFQVAGAMYMDIGNFSKMQSTMNTSNWDTIPKSREEMDIFFSKYKSEEALPFVKSKIKNEQIVIINEAHHQPFHRIFTLELLEELYDLGFRYFGLETLDERDTTLNQRKYPNTDSGFYTKEPQFGELVREALKFGFQLFAYEKIEEGLDREVEQAKNIQKMIDKDPSGKFLIHCGFTHAAEGQVPGWGKAMAGRLKEFTGINPLTINQSDFTEASDKSSEDPLYQNLDPKYTSVYLDSLGESYKYEPAPDYFDIMIFNKRTKMKNNRPEWVFHSGKKPIELKLTDLDIKLPALVMAFYPDEDYTKAVPADIQELENVSDTIYLALKPGKYNVVIQNAVPEARKYVLNVK